jgi:signal transduction histidine kinase
MELVHLEGDEGIDPLVKMATAELKISLSLLDEMLLWISSQMNERGLIRESLKLIDIVEEARHAVAIQAASRNIAINIRIESDDEVLVNHQVAVGVIRNLLTNALKFSENGKDIKVFLYEKNNKAICICVEDQGKGMTQSEVDLLFKQGKSTEGVRGEKGAGVGLLITRKLLEMMGGELHVESRPGAGSQFYIYFPIH